MMVTLADLLEQLGGIAPARVRFRPVPGAATEEDMLAIHDREGRLYELVDGVLVEKAMGLRESYLAIVLSTILWNFVQLRNLGLVTGEAGMMRLMAGLVRIPDVAFISWTRLPHQCVPTEPVPDLAPDLAVEVLNAGNTPGEMVRKRQEYFAAGVHLVWQVDPNTRTVEVFTAPDQSTVLHETQTLIGGTVLPGFTLPLQQLFGELDRRESVDPNRFHGQRLAVLVHALTKEGQVPPADIERAIRRKDAFAQDPETHSYAEEL